MANIELGGEPYFPNPYNIVPPSRLCPLGHRHHVR
jgi:hypothetical protein